MGGSPATGGSPASGGVPAAGSGGGAAPPNASLCVGAGTGAACTGRYRNLFAELGIAEAEVTGRLDRAYAQLFHGGDDERVFYEVAADQAYILDVFNGDVRSEGVSYGMMISVQLDKRAEFDRLWRWADVNLRHKTGARAGYFAWRWKDGRIADPNPAPDGEEYMVTALLFASARWGDGSGLLDYRAQAQSILTALLHKEDNGVQDSVTNAFNRNNHLVVFTPYADAATFTDPSYHLPAFYELWARWADRDREFWAAAAVASRAFLGKVMHPQTGLAPDYANFDGSLRSVGRNFHYDAWRVAGNVAMDASWFGAPSPAIERLLRFFASQGPGYVNQYEITGRALAGVHSPGLVAMNAAAALARPELGALERPFVEELWRLDVPSGRGRYYDGMLYLLGMLHASGRFRVWSPR